MIYLASPYSHLDALVREARFDAACRATADLVRAGHAVFSPIVHGHPLVRLGLPTDWSFWQRFDEDHLQRCDVVLVLQADGWQESEGVWAEVALAEALCKPVFYLPAENDGVSLSWHHAPPVAHVGQRPAGGPVGRTSDPSPTSRVLLNDVPRRANA